MPKRAKIRVIIDTNLFISFLIGKRLKGLNELLVNSNVILIFSEQNIQEILMVSRREKFRKYFSKDKVNELITFIRIIGEVFEIGDCEEICRDPKDDFLLALAKVGKADFLVSGDQDLLEIQTYHNTQIRTIHEFERLFGKNH